jgi:hypothetical protein
MLFTSFCFEVGESSPVLKSTCMFLTADSFSFIPEGGGTRKDD